MPLPAPPTPPESFPRDLVPPGASAELLLGPGDPDSLYPEEATAVAKAAPKRKSQFAAGRACARRALERLGLQGTAIAINDDRSPHWPEGIVGSISHSDQCCIAVVAYYGEIASVGVDVESSAPLAAQLESAVLSSEESRQLEAYGAPGRLSWAKVAFSAKESLYKCYRPVTGRFLGFHDARIELDPARGHVFMELTRSDLPDALGARRFTGRFTVRDGYVFTSVWLPAPRGHASALR